MNTNLFIQRVSAALCISAALILPMSAVNAQEEEVLEEIITTGSRIARTEFTSSSPITVVTGDQVAMSGVVSIDEYLKDIPAFTGYQMGTSTNNGSDQGQKKLDLRGLGFNRTLVLINGRRMIGDNATDGAVDLNSIPESMIKRIEVLKDGASTIYGSDAIAGIINIILHDDFEGLEFSARYGEGTEDGQAANSMISMLGGVASDMGNMVMSLSWTDQAEMVQAEKSWAYENLYPQLDANGDVFATRPDGRSETVVLLSGSLVLSRLAWFRLRFTDGCICAELMLGDPISDPRWQRLQLIWQQSRMAFVSKNRHPV